MAKKSATPKEKKYPEITERKGKGEDALTVEQSKDLLGWTEEPDKGKWQSKFDFLDLNKNKIRCVKNVHNRPLYWSVIDGLKQSHLKKQWRYNGEPIIVGEYGTILNGQHTLISHILAEQERVGKDKDHWKDFWPGPITMEKMIVFGIEESDDVINTMDTCRPRSIGDVLYRSAYFSTKSGADRQECSRICDYAIKTLWFRTGVTNDAFAPRRTHAEVLDFLDHHKRLLEAVNFIFEENVRDHDDSDPPKLLPAPIGRFLHPGYAAAFMYLMGTSTSDGDKYRDDRREKVLKFDNWDKAQTFWVLLKSQSEELKPLIKAFGELANKIGGASRDETFALFAKAWVAYLTNGKVTPSKIALKYDIDPEDGTRVLAEPPPSVGGIDLGDPEEAGKEAKRMRKEAEKAAKEMDELAVREAAAEEARLAEETARAEAEGSGGEEGEKEPDESVIIDTPESLPTEEEIEAGKAREKARRQEEMEEKEKARKAEKAAKRAEARAEKNGSSPKPPPKPRKKSDYVETPVSATPE